MIWSTLKLALVTGASSGLGKALAEALSQRGVRLILTGRDPSQLAKLSQELPTDARYLSLNLSLASDRKKLIEEIERSSPDLIINNAGFGLYGSAIDHPLEDQLDMIDLNVNAVVAVTLAAGRQWKREGKRGIVLNVASAAAFFAYPLFAVYAATKSFVLNFSIALDEELSPYGIRILTSCPGQIATGFRKRASQNFSQKADRRTMSAAKAAQLILQQIEKEKVSLIIDWRYRWGVRLVRFLPQRLIRRLLAQSLSDRIKPSSH
jgi:short-subunit dehydrogenase